MLLKFDDLPKDVVEPLRIALALLRLLAQGLGPSNEIMQFGVRLEGRSASGFAVGPTAMRVGMDFPRLKQQLVRLFFEAADDLGERGFHLIDLFGVAPQDVFQPAEVARADAVSTVEDRRRLQYPKRETIPPIGSDYPLAVEMGSQVYDIGEHPVGHLDLVNQPLKAASVASSSKATGSVVSGWRSRSKNRCSCSM